VFRTYPPSPNIMNVSSQEDSQNGSCSDDKNSSSPGASLSLSLSSLPSLPSLSSSRMDKSQSQSKPKSDIKEDEIRHCLNNVEAVNLWELRHLALSEGGLKSIALRRQAWPKLLAVHQVLWNAQQPQQKQKQPQQPPQQQAPSLYLYHPTPKDIKAVRKLVKGAISWNIPNDAAPNHHPPPPPPPSSSTMTVDGDTGKAINTDSGDKKTPLSPRRVVSFHLPKDDHANEDDGDDGNNTPLPSSCSKQERTVVRKVLTHLKRIHPDYVQFAGLQNLVALLLVVLESPSMTSIVVQQLVDYHWRLLPILKKHTSTYLPLLKVWDPVLHHHLTTTLGVGIGIGIQESTPLLRISASWIPGWFTQDISNVSVLLRLWDVFLVSHPTFVMYVHKCVHKCIHTCIHTGTVQMFIDALFDLI
jgi:hypothetical protein